MCIRDSINAEYGVLENTASVLAVMPPRRFTLPGDELVGEQSELVLGIVRTSTHSRHAPETNEKALATTTEEPLFHRDPFANHDRMSWRIAEEKVNDVVFILEKVRLAGLETHMERETFARRVVEILGPDAALEKVQYEHRFAADGPSLLDQCLNSKRTWTEERQLYGTAPPDTKAGRLLALHMERKPTSSEHAQALADERELLRRLWAQQSGEETQCKESADASERQQASPTVDPLIEQALRHAETEALLAEAADTQLELVGEVGSDSQKEESGSQQWFSNAYAEQSDDDAPEEEEEEKPPASTFLERFKYYQQLNTPTKAPADLNRAAATQADTPSSPSPEPEKQAQQAKSAPVLAVFKAEDGKWFRGMVPRDEEAKLPPPERAVQDEADRSQAEWFRAGANDWFRGVVEDEHADVLERPDQQIGGPSWFRGCIVRILQMPVAKKDPSDPWFTGKKAGQVPGAQWFKGDGKWFRGVVVPRQVVHPLAEPTPEPTFNSRGEAHSTPSQPRRARDTAVQRGDEREAVTLSQALGSKPGFFSEGVHRPKLRSNQHQAEHDDGSNEDGASGWRRGLKKAHYGQMSDDTLHITLPFAAANVSKDKLQASVAADGTVEFQQLHSTKTAQDSWFSGAAMHNIEASKYFDELSGGAAVLEACQLEPLLRRFWKEASYYSNEMSDVKAERMSTELSMALSPENGQVDKPTFVAWYIQKRYHVWPAYIGQIDQARREKWGDNTSGFTANSGGFENRLNDRRAQLKANPHAFPLTQIGDELTRKVQQKQQNSSVHSYSRWGSTAAMRGQASRSSEPDELSQRITQRRQAAADAAKYGSTASMTRSQRAGSDTEDTELSRMMAERRRREEAALEAGYAAKYGNTESLIKTGAGSSSEPQGELARRLAERRLREEEGAELVHRTHQSESKPQTELERRMAERRRKEEEALKSQQTKPTGVSSREKAKTSGGSAAAETREGSAATVIISLAELEKLSFMKLKLWLVEHGVSRDETNLASGKKMLLRLATKKGLASEAGVVSEPAAADPESMKADPEPESEDQVFTSEPHERGVQGDGMYLQSSKTAPTLERLRGATGVRISRAARQVSIVSQLGLSLIHISEPTRPY
eukprot:TRINITY_DN9052_c0_g1_i1.p1 TRINITY_DN9052_c0_g1~~TRINITY_DN9052_c0_g1_i1.p1  ORF type:complete len:1115 (+),score=276.91 TRINITY_DN9052_c0_g1_i1:154-3498(+)